MENFIATDLGFSKPTGAFSPKGEIEAIVENRRHAQADEVAPVSPKPNLMSIISTTLTRVRNMAIGL